MVFQFLLAPVATDPVRGSELASVAKPKASWRVSTSDTKLVG